MAQPRRGQDDAHVDSEVPNSPILAISGEDMWGTRNIPARRSTSHESVRPATHIAYTNASCQRT